MKKKKLCILGSTGSIGRNALNVISDIKDKFELIAISAHSNVPLLAEQANRFRPRIIAITDETKAGELKKRLKFDAILLAGDKAQEELAKQKDFDIVLVAISGSASIRPTYAAVSAGKDVALASKEALVSAGHLIMREAKRKAALIIPVDSEHSAVFQCLAGNGVKDINRLYITSSGGPLLRVPAKGFRKLRAKDVLRHPNWNMCKKISVDSATMMNKGLEIIEAKWLFGIGIENIKILIHPEAIIHSMVEFIDGSILAQLAITDMRLPIQYALAYPERHKNSLKHLDLIKAGKLTFYEPDTVKFPSLKLAYEAAKEGGSATCVLNSANEAAVRGFLNGRISFTDIPIIIEKVMSRHKKIEFPSLDEVDALGIWAEEEVERFC